MSAIAMSILLFHALATLAALLFFAADSTLFSRKA